MPRLEKGKQESFLSLNPQNTSVRIIINFHVNEE